MFLWNSLVNWFQFVKAMCSLHSWYNSFLFQRICPFFPGTIFFGLFVFLNLKQPPRYRNIKQKKATSRNYHNSLLRNVLKILMIFLQTEAVVPRRLKIWGLAIMVQKWYIQNYLIMKSKRFVVLGRFTKPPAICTG